MFSKRKLKDGSTLQEISRVGCKGQYEFTPAGSREPTLIVNAHNSNHAKFKLIDTGHLKLEEFMHDPAEDIRSISGGPVRGKYMRPDAKLELDKKGKVEVDVKMELKGRSFKGK